MPVKVFKTKVNQILWLFLQLLCFLQYTSVPLAPKIMYKLQFLVLGARYTGSSFCWSVFGKFEQNGRWPLAFFRFFCCKKCFQKDKSFLKKQSRLIIIFSFSDFQNSLSFLQKTGKNRVLLQVQKSFARSLKEICKDF